MQDINSINPYYVYSQIQNKRINPITGVVEPAFTNLLLDGKPYIGPYHREVPISSKKLGETVYYTGIRPDSVRQRLRWVMRAVEVHPEAYALARNQIAHPSPEALQWSITQGLDKSFYQNAGVNGISDNINPAGPVPIGRETPIGARAPSADLSGEIATSGVKIPKRDILSYLRSGGVPDPIIDDFDTTSGRATELSQSQSIGVLNRSGHPELSLLIYQLYNNYTPVSGGYESAPTLMGAEMRRQEYQNLLDQNFRATLLPLSVIESLGKLKIEWPPLDLSSPKYSLGHTAEILQELAANYPLFAQDLINSHSSDDLRRLFWSGASSTSFNQLLNNIQNYATQVLLMQRSKSAQRIIARKQKSRKPAVPAAPTAPPVVTPTPQGAASAPASAPTAGAPASAPTAGAPAIPQGAAGTPAAAAATSAPRKSGKARATSPPGAGPSGGAGAGPLRLGSKTPNPTRGMTQSQIPFTKTKLATPPPQGAKSKKPSPPKPP
jgi:hypothetical protein